MLIRRCAAQLCWQHRHFRTRSANPGVSRRLKIFKDENPDLSKVKLPESDFDDMEVDIMNKRALRESYEREHRKLSKTIDFQRIERQYFDKAHNPNFLTWSEKEQIRQLYDSDPDKWTFSKLSTSFPATMDTIKKIVKARWMLKEPEAIRKHDERVAANWKAFKEQKLDLQHSLTAHLSRFTSRDRLLKPKDSVDLIRVEGNAKASNRSFPTKNKEFVNIVRNYNRKEEIVEEEESAGENRVPTRPSDTYVMRDGKARTRVEHMTLSAVKQVDGHPPADQSLSTAPGAESMEASADAPPKENRERRSQSDFFTVQRSSAKAPSKDLPMDAPPEDIPMRITIPQDKKRKGAIYRVNNCFYAEDGEFLYKI